MERAMTAVDLVALPLSERRAYLSAIAGAAAEEGNMGYGPCEEDDVARPQKLAYIAGPYMVIDQLQVEQHILIAQRAAADIVRGTGGKWGFICPHTHSAGFQNYVDVDQEWWYTLDYKLLDICGAIVMVGDWQDSAGEKRELEYARERSIPAYFGVQSFLFGVL